MTYEDASDTIDVSDDINLRSSRRFALRFAAEVLVISLVFGGLGSMLITAQLDANEPPLWGFIVLLLGTLVAAWRLFELVRQLVRERIHAAAEVLREERTTDS